MKRMILMAAMLVSIVAMAQEPVMTFEKTTHDFGKINEADGRVTTVFEFKNEGMTPLVLSNVRASCGCTTPKWTREPIEPGATGNITVTYNPNGRPGRFQKTITITSNAKEATVRLYIKGEVIPKPTKPVEQYPIAMGVLKLKKKSLNFGIIKNTTTGKMLEIEYSNSTNEVIHVDLLTSSNYNYFKPYVTLQEVKPGETGKFQISIQHADCPLWGPVKGIVYVMVNGERKQTDEYAITLEADIQEDFTQMTAEEKQLAPIAEIPSTINLGTFKAGKKVLGKLVFSNSGVNPLLVRRIIANDSAINVISPKSGIKGGKKGEAKIEINTVGMQAGNYSRTLTVITNDPGKSITKITMNWVVE